MKYKCNSCNVEWDYPVDSCIFCCNTVSKIDVSLYTVEGVTQVFVPSDDHPITPYYVMLLRDLDDNNNYRFQKTFERHDVGDTIYIRGNNEKRYVVGVIGTGVTGRGIVELALKTGNKVILKSRSEASLKDALHVISKDLSKELEPDKLEVVLNRLMTTTRYEPLAEADLIIESVVEDLHIKKDIFRKLDSICTSDIILASNTSSLSISKISSDLEYSQRVIGLHFFNPIPRMELVELIKGKNTDENVLKHAQEFIININKTSVTLEDTPGFIVNRLLFLMINQACHMLDAGIASVEDIDNAMKMGANHPMGPFQLADFIGIDLCLSILEVMYGELKNDSYRPAQVLHNMVIDDKLGRKVGMGFYKYR